MPAESHRAHPDRDNVEESYLRRLPVPAGDGLVHFVKASEILWIEAANQYVRVHTADAALLLRLPLSVLERKLDPREFIRIHRGSIVRLDAVTAMQRTSSTRGEAILYDDSRLPVSESHWSELSHALVGTEYDIGD